MKLQFTEQDYQTQALQAVIDVFKGQPLTEANVFDLNIQNNISAINNQLLSDEQLLENVQPLIIIRADYHFI